MQLLLLDISRAYFNAKMDPDKPTYVQLPDEVGAPPGTCALLRKHMYGTQKAAEGWQEECSCTFHELVFTRGHASPCIFYHSERGSVTSVHAHDFSTTG